MLTIKSLSIKEEVGYATLFCDILEDNALKTVWFQVDAKYRDYLVDERVDAFVIALLNYAMRNGHDITSTHPITERLHYQLDTYLIETLSRTSKKLYRTRLLMPTVTTNLECANGVGTGISCGVDSLHAVFLNSKSKNSTLNITHLCFNNVGSHGKGNRAKLLFEGRRKLAQKFCNEYGYEYVESNSNLMDVFEQDHYLSHTYSSCFPVFCLRKLFNVYYYASGTSYLNFSLQDNERYPPCKYELLSLPNFSLNNFVIYSEGALKSRNDKLKSIIDYSPSFKYLNVCTDSLNNCSKCEKCIRTLVALDSLKVLDRYSTVFDIEYYRNNRAWYLSQLYTYYSIGKPDYLTPYNLLKDQISFKSKIKSVPSIVKYKLFNRLHNDALYDFCRSIYRRFK